MEPDNRFGVFQDLAVTVDDLVEHLFRFRYVIAVTDAEHQVDTALALGGDVLLQIARQRSHDLDLVPGQELVIADTPAEFAAAVIPHGTTSMFIDPHEIANVLGLPGVRLMHDEALTLPVNVYVQMPSCVPSAPGLETPGASIGPAEVAEAMQWPGIIGLGEMMNFPGVLFRVPAVLEKLESAGGRPIDGHAPGLSGLDLNAYVAAGVGSDHE